MTLTTWIEQRAGEIRLALRAIGRTPGPTTVAIVSLALGIGANTAVFSVVSALFLSRLPVRAPQELHVVAQMLQGRPNVVWSYVDYRTLREATGALSDLMAFTGPQALGMQAAGTGQSAGAELVAGSFVSMNFFDALGVDPAAGRVFGRHGDERPGGCPEVVFGHEFWQRRFAGQSAVIGSTIRLNGFPLTVVGIARAGFRGIDVTRSPDLFVPITMRTEVAGIPVNQWTTRSHWWLQIAGRLRRDATPARAAAELTATLEAEAARGAAASRDARHRPLVLISAASGYSATRTALRTPLLALAGMVGVVLVIACANVASLLVARGAARQREMAIRLATGASHRHLVSQLLTESVLLGLLGGAGGLVVAWGGVRVLLSFLPRFGGQHATLAVSPDLPVLAFTAAVSVATGVLFGLAPALQAARLDLTEQLRARSAEAGPRSRLAMRRLLVVGQVALSLVLLVGAGLFVRTIANLRSAAHAVEPERALLVRVDPSRNGYTGARLEDFYGRLREAAGRLPGVDAASLAEITPLSGARSTGPLSVEGYTPAPGERMAVDTNAVSPHFFESLGIRLLAGRDFAEADSDSAQAGRREDQRGARTRSVVVSESVARRFFGDRDPIGRRLCLDATFQTACAHEIVGVVQDVHYAGLRGGPDPIVYLPIWSEPGTRTLCVRTAGRGAAVVEAVRRLVRAIDTGVPVLSARTLRQDVDNHLANERLLATLATAFGVLAATLAAIGLYGLVAYSVTRRTHEFAVRMALGATRAGIIRLVLGGAARLVLSGATVGALVALLAGRVLTALLFGISAGDPTTLAAGLALLLGVTLAAAAVPARRASNVPPMTALRGE